MFSLSEFYHLLKLKYSLINIIETVPTLNYCTSCIMLTSDKHFHPLFKTCMYLHPMSLNGNIFYVS